MKKLYFIVGSQDLYGEECLKQVAEDSRQMVAFLNEKVGDLAEIELLPTVETSEICIQDMRKASNDDDCVGVITWMHTFSPAKMWIKGLQELRKPLLHLHTQANEKLPYDEIDMDFMNLNQSAHGDREYGFIVARMGIPHEVVAGYYKHDDVVAKIRQFASVAKAITTYMTGGVGTITPAGYFWLNTWGSARYNTAAQLCALVYDKYNNNGKPSEYSEWAKEQMQYLMGNNPMNRAYIVGYSENAAKYPHHRAASGLTRAEDTREQRHVLYGALVGGPDASDKHNDVTADWIYNEVTIDYNAAFVGASAGLYAYFGDDSMQVTPDFPPKEENNGEEGGGNNYWVEAFAVNNPCAGGAGTTKISMKVMTDSITPRTDVTVRYFFNTKEMTSPNLVEAKELYDQAATEAAPADGVISGPFQYDASYDPNIYYFEVAWDGYTIANSNKKYQCSVGLYYGDQWDASNDWSYQDLPILTDSEMFGDGNEVKSDYICVYAGGELVGGTEPNGSTPKPAETTTTSTTTATTTTTTTTTVTNATTTESEVSTTSATEVTTTESKPATTTSLTEATTTESTTTATTEAGTEIYYGDVNQDGVVDLADAIVMNKALANVITLSESAAKCADCYDDGILDDKDATILMRFVIGKINDVPSKEL